MPSASVSILAATPCYGGMASIVFVNALLQLQKACAARGVGLEIRLSGGDALISRARSQIATAFLRETDHTHLLFIDADIGFSPEHLFRLLSLGKPVSGGVYPLKRILWDKVPDAVRAGMADVQAASLGYVVRFLPSPTSSVEVTDGFGPVSYVGTGFMLIAREVFERMAEAHPELHCTIADVNDVQTSAIMFFETMIDPDTAQHLSEDYAFCKRWRDLGGEIWADFQTPMSHVGHAVYRGGLMDAVRT
jgi:hypothetical protein